MDKKAEKFAVDLLQYLNDSPTAYHAVENGAALLKSGGFQELKETESWSLQEGGKYFVVKTVRRLLPLQWAGAIFQKRDFG